MARYIIQGIARDVAGNVIEAALVKVYVAGTTTLATFYPDTVSGASTGVYTDVSGKWKVYLDSDDYIFTDIFDITITKSGYSEDTIYSINPIPSSNTGAIEAAQDAVGAILDDGTVGNIVFTYNDSTPKISATLQASEIKLDDLGTPDDNTDLNASTTRHGLLKKLSNVSTEFMNGAGNWATPAYPSAASEGAAGIAEIATQAELDAGTDDTRIVTAEKLLATPMIYRRNVIINGGFRVNQRVYASTATLAAGAYGHDRWKAGSGGGNYSFTQSAGLTTITIAADKTLIQVVEDKNVIGGSYILSWTGTAEARYAVNSATPAGNYATSPIVITGQNAGTTMSVEFSAGTLGGVQLEVGTAATPFEFRPFGQELAACQRYFEKSFPYATAPAQAAGYEGCYYWQSVRGAGATEMVNPIRYAVAKRDEPTVTIYNIAAANAEIRNATASADFSGTAVDGSISDEGGFSVYGTTPAGHLVTHGCAFQWTSAIEL